MNGDAVRYESDHYKATAGFGARKRDLQLVFFDAQYPKPDPTAADRPSVESQTMNALERVEAAVGRSGLDLDDVLRTTVYTTDLDRIDAVESAYDAYFDDRRPAMTVVGVSELPNDAAVQIEATGVKR
ncbi:RidA family protein [Haloferax volcanii]|uniref:RidA family protein n=1 Tax=Haloferax volcanii TaxID=2246 RepID=UPI00249ADD0D|nr:RidA family protein [Haloferax alexandrinus]WEL29703.1 Translation initiation inhibitor, yjgF family [Haloferax alexandrinus]